MSQSNNASFPKDRFGLGDSANWLAAMGLYAEMETMVLVRSLSLSSITFSALFWVTTFSAGSQRPSSWVIKLGLVLESGAGN